MLLSENPEDDGTDLAGLKHRSLHGAGATAGAQVVKFVLQLVSQIWLARLISPSEYGLIAMVAPILGFISVISDLGIGTALIQQRSISQSQISALFWVNTSASLVISLVIAGISPALGALYHEPKTVPITIALALLFFISTLSIHPSALLNRNMRLAQRAVIECIQNTVGLIVGIVTAMAGCSYWSLVYLQAASTITGVVLTWWSVRWVPSAPRWDPSVMRILRFGTSLSLSNLASYLTLSADDVIIGVVSGKIAVGLYDKAYRLVLQPLSQLSAPIGRVAIPLLSRLVNDSDRYSSAFRRMIQLPLLICVPALICGTVLSAQIVHVFLGPSWSGLAPVFSWVCVGGLTSTLYGSASWLFTSQGRGREQMNWTIITSVISIASFAIGVRWGAVGVACVGALGFVGIQTPMIMWAATRTGPVTAKTIVLAIRPMLVGLVLTLPIAYFYTRIVRASAIVELIGAVALTGTVYAMVLGSMSSGRSLMRESVDLIHTYVSLLRTKLRQVLANS